MNSKKVNRLFFVMILVHLVVVGLLSFVFTDVTIGIVPSLLLSQMIVAVPAAIFWFTSKGQRKQLLAFCKVKISSLLMIILFTYLMMPLTTVLNAVSMLFVDNAVAGISKDVLDMPFLVMFFVMAVFAPFSEEVVFRGVVYRGYRNSGTTLQAMLLSALLFGLIHMNFNQAPYAFVLGIVLVLLVEATGSIWASVLFHVVFNANSVCLLFLTEKLLPDIDLEESAAVVGDEQWMISICVYMVIAFITTAIAACVLTWIADNEGRLDVLKAIWTERKNIKGKMLTGVFWVALLLCMAYMIFTTVILGV